MKLQLQRKFESAPAEYNRGIWFMLLNSIYSMCTFAKGFNYFLLLIYILFAIGSKNYNSYSSKFCKRHLHNKAILIE